MLSLLAGINCNYSIPEQVYLYGMAPVEKMKILILWPATPHPFHPSYARPYYFMKFYASETSITLLSPHVNMQSFTLPSEVKCEAVPIHTFESPYLKILLSTIGRITLTNMRYARDFNLFKSYFPPFQRAINSIIKRDDFDIIYSHYQVCSYLLRHKLAGRINAPVILEFFSPILYAQREFFKSEILSEKLRAFAKYVSFRLFEVGRYKHFEGGIYVSKTHLELSKPFLPKRCFIIPPGVDVEHFKPSNTCSNDPSLLFVGSMHYTPNILGILYFYSRVYPYVKREVSHVRFYIVGRNPDARIKKLGSDPSVIVTGTVKDVRPYLSTANVFINPVIIDDGGIKSKVLEAMAMGKAVVSTPLGVRDLGVTNERNIIVAKNDEEFAEKVVSLLKDENYRKRIGLEARRFVEDNYSWEKQSRTLYMCLKELMER
ncbi:MAG: glycosyltransferase family 4 protein [Nitrososphaeria archaeon]